MNEVIIMNEEENEWDCENIEKFIELYKSQPCLWDPKHPMNKNRKCLADAWAVLQVLMKEETGMKLTIDQLKRKKESIMAVYRTIKGKIRHSIRTGAKRVYRPKWYAFNAMDEFLGAIHDSPNITMMNIKREEQSQVNSLDKEQSGSTGETEANYDHSNPEIDSVEFYIEDEDVMTEGVPRKRPRIDTDDEVNIEDERKLNKHLDKTHETLKLVNASRDKEDEIDLFCQLTALKLRKISNGLRRDMIMHKINTILYDQLFAEISAREGHLC